MGGAAMPRLRILLVDNSKPEVAVFTPLLRGYLSQFADVTSCRTRTEAVARVNERFDGVVLSGSSLNISETLHTAAIAKDLMVLLRHTDTPCLGICFGMQLMAVAYGGEVARLPREREGVRAVCTRSGTSLLDAGTHEAYFSHRDAVVEAPDSFEVDAESEGIIAAISWGGRRKYGLQYHPEKSQGPSARAVERFLATVRADCAVIHDCLVGTREWEQIAMLIGKARAPEVARTHSLPEEAVLAIWTAFRRRFRIPAIML